MGFDFVFQTLHGFSAWMYPYDEPKTTWTVINEYLMYVWYNSFMVFMNILMLIGLIGFVYICYLTIYKARSEQKSCDTTRSLSVYNNTMNIHVWLNQAEDYLDDRNIKSDTRKQAIVLERLEKNAKNIIHRLQASGKIKTFQDMEHQLKSLYGTENLSAIDYLKQLADRRQYDHESLSQFYDALTTLTQQAYPDTPLSMLHKYTDQHL